MTGKTPTPKEDEIAQRQAAVSALYFAGLPQYQIATQLTVSDATVSRDLREIREKWLESAIFNFNEAKLRELAVIDRVENEAWQAWIASTEELETTETRGKKGGPVLAATKKIEDRSGNPALLNVILKCVEARVKILGLEAAQNIKIGTEDGKPLPIRLVDMVTVIPPEREDGSGRDAD